jgi:hypothetical protein
LIGPQYEIESSFNQGKIYILNEGNFGSGNGSITRYDINTKSSSTGIFQAQNGIPLGDIPQDMIRLGDEYWISVNNSGKVLVCDTNFNLLNQIMGLGSPRFLKAFGSKVLCTDLYGNGVHILDPSSYSKTGFIPVSDWTEQLEVVGNECWISGVNTGRVYTINQQFNLVDSISLSKGPGKAIKDQNDLVWIMCSGGYQDQQPVLYQLNPQNKQVLQQYNFGGINNSPGSLQVNAAMDSLFFLSGGIWTSSIYNAGSFHSVYNGNHTYYGLKYLGQNRMIFTDAKNYAINGWAYVLSTAGSIIDSLECDIIPGTIFSE